MAEGSAERSRRMLLLLAPVALARAAQLPGPVRDRPEDKEPDTHLPNGKRQIDEILKADHEQNLRDARELESMASSFQSEMEKTDRFVLSIPLLKKLDDMEKLVRRIRSRLKK